MAWHAELELMLRVPSIRRQQGQIFTGCCPNTILVVLVRYSGMVAFLTY